MTTQSRESVLGWILGGRADTAYDSLLTRAAHGELDHALHEPDAATGGEPIAVENEPPLARAVLRGRQAVERSYIVVVKVSVEPDHVGQIPDVSDGPGVVPIDDRDGFTIPSQDVPRTQSPWP